MHSSSFESGSIHRDGGDVLVGIAALVTEGRIPGKSKAGKNFGFHEGPHCHVIGKSTPLHDCNTGDELCQKYDQIRNEVLNLWQRSIPLCVEVALSTACPCKETSGEEDGCGSLEKPEDLLLEQWYFSISHNRSPDSSSLFNLSQLVGAVRSQLHFSQISAWLSSQEQEQQYDQSRLCISNSNLRYNLTIPGETFERSKFSSNAIKHEFPATDIGNGYLLKVTLHSLPRMAPPTINCAKCAPKKMAPKPQPSLNDEIFLLDDRMHLSCTLKGKHRCEDVDEFELKKEQDGLYKRVCCHDQPSTSSYRPHSCCTGSSSSSSASNSSEKRNLASGVDQPVKTPKLDFKSNRAGFNQDLKEQQEKKSKRSDALLNAILRSCRLQDENFKDQGSTSRVAESVAAAGMEAIHPKRDAICVQKLGELGTSILNGCAKALQSVGDKNGDRNCSSSSSKSDIFSYKPKLNIYVDDCDNERSVEDKGPAKMRDISNTVGKKVDANRQIVEKQSGGIEIPSSVEKAKFRKSLDNAASMVFHARTGLPLTSSPAPARRGKSCFDFDSSINSVSAIKTALFSASFSTDDDSESDGSTVSPCSPETYIYTKKDPSPVKQYRRGQTANLLGSFEESVLNGRLEPVSTVHGFKAELGASGSFVPRHLVVPVTVFFYTLGDNDKVSSPYLGHMNLGKKRYYVPETGTVQLTLFNPLGTVVKMFVIMYDLSDMPPNSETFLRQRTLYMPTKCQDKNVEWGPKWLRYLIHLRFHSSKTGRIYLHSDIRMIIFRKSDMDTATAHGIDMCYELRSFTHMPSNPKYSPRK